MSDVQVPHLALPFRIVAGAAVVNEQDTIAEISDCVRAILSYPRGYRVELPDFGIPDLPFRQGGADAAAVRAAVEQWEPRVELVTEVDNRDLDELISTVTVQIRAGEGAS